jgi:hypothetical protein
LQVLIQSLIFDSQVPAIDLGSIIDSMAWSSEFRRSEYSFITHIKNREQTDVGWEYLYAVAQKGEGGWRLFKDGGR